MLCRNTGNVGNKYKNKSKIYGQFLKKSDRKNLTISTYTPHSRTLKLELRAVPHKLTEFIRRVRGMERYELRILEYCSSQSSVHILRWSAANGYRNLTRSLGGIGTSQVPLKLVEPLISRRRGLRLENRINILRQAERSTGKCELSSCISGLHKIKIKNLNLTCFSRVEHSLMKFRGRGDLLKLSGSRMF